MCGVQIHGKKQHTTHKQISQTNIHTLDEKSCKTSRHQTWVEYINMADEVEALEKVDYF